MAMLAGAAPPAFGQQRGEWSSQVFEPLPGYDASLAMGASADGSVVVGYCVTLFGSSTPFRWTQATGMIDLGAMPGHSNGLAEGVSDDGSVVVGQFASSLEAFRRHKATGFQILVRPPGLSSASGCDASHDGTVVVGGARLPTLDKRAFRWVEGKGMFDLGVLPGAAMSDASRVSADGRVVVGWSGVNIGLADKTPFRWTPQGGMVDLGQLPGTTNCRATDVSANGSVVVGYCQLPGSSESRAFRWTEAGGLQQLSQGHANAWGVSTDGRVLAGYHAPEGVSYWTAQTGWRSILADLVAHNVPAPPIGFLQIRDVEGAGSVYTIVGHGETAQVESRGWRATIVLPCLADCDSNNTLNVLDYICFQTKFALGDPYSDCDGNGVRDVNDYICFQTSFALGCP